jgi:hypothetical protein
MMRRRLYGAYQRINRYSKRIFGLEQGTGRLFCKYVVGAYLNPHSQFKQTGLRSKRRYSTTFKNRRLQRFFAGYLINYDQIARFIFKIFFIQGGSWYLTMDRTNWRWGEADINVLMLGIAYKGAAIPIYWELLNKRGNSDTPERIALMQKFIDQFGKECIKGILADREFIGKEWFAWLLKEAISFNIRIKNNTVTTNARGLSVDIDGLFYDLKVGEQSSLQGRRKVWGHLLYLAGLRLADGDLLIVATPEEPESAIKNYGLRWEIETLFGCLKGRGFHFEDTHITETGKD